MDKVTAGHISSQTTGRVCTITFYHPSHNSLPGKLLAELREAIDQAGDSRDNDLIVIQSEGNRTFCAGASFDELVAINDLDTGKKFFMGFANVINAIRRSPKIVIGRVQGKAVGGGVGIASACDYCMATKYASVKLSELAVGIGPFVIGPAVERKVGLSAFSQMALDATSWQTAAWAQQRGLYIQVYDSIEELDEGLHQFTSELSYKNPEALKLLKSVFWVGTENWNELLEERAEMSGRLVLSDYAKNAIQGFLKG